MPPKCEHCDRHMMRDAIGHFVCVFCHFNEKPFPVEVNGAANIITMLDISHEQGVYPDLAAIRAEAVRTIRYLEALGRGERPKWHEIKGDS